ncbi:MAG: hypothetical protein ACRCU8_00650 [Cetobacterium sp.]
MSGKHRKQQGIDKDINNRIEKIVRSCENNKTLEIAKPFRWLKGVKKS